MDKHENERIIEVSYQKTYFDDGSVIRGSVYFASKEGWDSPGNRPKDNITPEPVWTTK